MDPLLLEAARTIAAVVTGAVVGWLGARWGLRNAEHLARDGAARREASLRHALISELRENLVRLAEHDSMGVPNALVVRSAWDEARTLPLSELEFDALARAYLAGEAVNRSVGMLIARATRGGS